MNDVNDSDINIDYEINKLSECQAEYRQADNIDKKIDILTSIKINIENIKDELKNNMNYDSQTIKPLFENITNNVIKSILEECESLMVNDTNSNQTNSVNKAKITDIYENIEKILKFKIFTHYLAEETKTTINTQMQQIATYCGKNRMPQQGIRQAQGQPQPEVAPQPQVVPIVQPVVNVQQQNNQENQQNGFEVIDNSNEQQNNQQKIICKDFGAQDVQNESLDLYQALTTGKTVKQDLFKRNFLSKYYNEKQLKDDDVKTGGERQLYDYIKQNDALIVMLNGRVLLINTTGDIKNNVANSAIWEFFAENLNDPGKIEYNVGTEIDRKDLIIENNLKVDEKNPLHVEIFVPGTDHHMSQINARFAVIYNTSNTERIHSARECWHDIEQNTIYFFPSNIYNGKFSQYATVSGIKDRMYRAGKAISEVINKIMLGKEDNNNIKTCCSGYSYGNLATIEALKNVLSNVKWIKKVDNIVFENPGPGWLHKAQTAKDIKNTMQEITRMAEVNNVCVTFDSPLKDLLHYKNTAIDYVNTLKTIDGIKHLYQKFNGIEEDLTKEISPNIDKFKINSGFYTCPQEEEKTIVIEIGDAKDIITLEEEEKITSENFKGDKSKCNLIAQDNKVEFTIEKDNAKKTYLYRENEGEIYKYLLEPKENDQYNFVYKSCYDREKKVFSQTNIFIFHKDTQRVSKSKSSFIKLDNLAHLNLLEKYLDNDKFLIGFLNQNNVKYEYLDHCVTTLKIKDLYFLKEGQNQEFFSKHFFKNFKTCNDIKENEDISEHKISIVMQENIINFVKQMPEMLSYDEIIEYVATNSAEICIANEYRNGKYEKSMKFNGVTLFTRKKKHTDYSINFYVQKLDKIKNKINLDLKKIVNQNNNEEFLKILYKKRMDTIRIKDEVVAQGRKIPQQTIQYLDNIMFEELLKYAFFKQESFLTEDLTNKISNKNQDIIIGVYSNLSTRELIGWKFNDKNNILIIGAINTTDAAYQLYEGRIYKFSKDRKVFDLYENNCRSNAEGKVTNGDLTLGDDSEITLSADKKLKLKKNDKVIIKNQKYLSQLQLENKYNEYLKKQAQIIAQQEAQQQNEGQQPPNNQLQQHQQNEAQAQQAGGQPQQQNVNQPNNQQQLQPVEDPSDKFNEDCYQWRNFREINNVEGTEVEIHRNGKKILSLKYEQNAITFKDDKDNNIGEDIQNYINNYQDNANDRLMQNDDINIDNINNEMNGINLIQKHENEKIENNDQNDNNQLDSDNNIEPIERISVDDLQKNNEDLNKSDILEKKPNYNVKEELDDSFLNNRGQYGKELFNLKLNKRKNIKRTAVGQLINIRDCRKCFNKESTAKYLFDGFSCPLTDFINKVAKDNPKSLAEKIINDNAVLVCYNGRVILIKSSNINRLYELFCDKEIKNKNAQLEILSNFQTDEANPLNIEVLIEEPDDALVSTRLIRDANNENYNKQQTQFEAFIRNKIIPRCEELLHPDTVTLHKGTSAQHNCNKNTMYIIPMASLIHNSSDHSNYLKHSNMNTGQILTNILYSKGKTKKNIKICFNGFGPFSNFQCAMILSNISNTNYPIDVNSANLHEMTNNDKIIDNKNKILQTLLDQTIICLESAARNNVNIKLLSLYQRPRTVNGKKFIFFNTYKQVWNDELFKNIKKIKQIQAIEEIIEKEDGTEISNTHKNELFYKQNIVSSDNFVNGKLSICKKTLIRFVFNKKIEASLELSGDTSFECQSWIDNPESAHMSNLHGQNYIEFKETANLTDLTAIKHYKIEKIDNNIYMYNLTIKGNNYSSYKAKYNKTTGTFDTEMLLETNNDTQQLTKNTTDILNYGILAERYLNDHADVFDFIRSKMPTFNQKKITSAIIKVKNSDLYEENDSLFKIIQEENKNDKENICRIDYQSEGETSMISYNFFLKNFSNEEYLKLYSMEENRFDDEIQISIRTPENVSFSITALRRVEGNFDLLKLIDDNQDIINTIKVSDDETPVFKEKYINKQLIFHDFTKENNTNLLRYIKSKMNFEKEVNSENNDDENTYTLAYVCLANKKKEFNTNHAGFFGYYFQKDDNAIWVGYIDRFYNKLEKEGVVFKFHDNDRKTYDVYTDAIASKGKLTKGKLQLGKDSCVAIYNNDANIAETVEFKQGYLISIETLSNEKDQWDNFCQINSYNFKQIIIYDNNNIKIATVNRDENSEVTYTLFYGDELGNNERKVNFSQFKDFIENSQIPLEEKHEDLEYKKQQQIEDIKNEIDQEAQYTMNYDSNIIDKKEESSVIEEPKQDEDKFLTEECHNRNQNRQTRQTIKNEKTVIDVNIKETEQNKEEQKQNEQIQNIDEEQIKTHTNVNDNLDDLEQDTDTPEQQTNNIDYKKEVDKTEKPKFNVPLFALLLIFTFILGAILYYRSYKKKVNKYKEEEKYQGGRKSIKNEALNNRRNQLYF